MLRILDILKPFGHARDRAAGKRRSRGQQPCVNPLEVRVLMASSFQGLGAGTNATAVSGDASVVVGNVSAATSGPFYWTQSNGVVFLRDSSGNIYPGTASGVSGNGSVIVGEPYGGAGGGGSDQAFRWANGFAAPIHQLASAPASTANAVSADGSIIVGDEENLGNWSGYRLTGASLEVIPLTSVNLDSAYGITISANGDVVAGQYASGIGGSNAYQWNNGVFTEFPDSRWSGTATAVSPDGSVVVGSVGYGTNGLTQAFEWTNGVVTALTWPAGYITGSATGVSNNGSAIVGYMSPQGNGIGGGQSSTAFIWNQANGIQDLQQVLTTDDGLGPSLTGWTLTAATAITPDGKTIVGNGIDPQGQQEGWIVKLSTTTVPPPPPQQTPSITWASPANIVYGTTLGATQLDAMASVPGTFTYSPPAGTVLTAGSNQALSVSFTPTDTTDYSGATATATINVLQATVSPQVHGTKTIVTAKPVTSMFGQPVTLTASVKILGAKGPTPAGTVTFSEGGIILGTAPLQGGKSRFTTWALPVGPDGIQASYSGDSALSGSSSAPFFVKVRGAKTKTGLTSSADPSRFGQAVTLSATVSGVGAGVGSPTGTVTFLDKATILGTITLVGGEATFTTNVLAARTHVIKAVYNGSVDFGRSTSNALRQTVKQSTQPASRGIEFMARADGRLSGFLPEE